MLVLATRVPAIKLPAASREKILASAMVLPEKPMSIDVIDIKGADSGKFAVFVVPLPSGEPPDI